MNTNDLMRINFAFEESKCEIADKIQRQTHHFIENPHRMKFYDLLTQPGVSGDFIGDIVAELPSIKQLVETKLWEELVKNPKFSFLVALAAQYPVLRPGKILNWELFELHAPEEGQPIPLDKCFYRSFYYEKDELLLMELVAPIEELDGLTDMYFILPECPMDLIIFFVPVAPDKFSQSLQNLSVSSQTSALGSKEKVVSALKYHLEEWKIYIAEAMAKIDPTLHGADIATLSYEKLFSASQFTGRFWQNLMEELANKCDGITIQEGMYLADFENLSGIIQTLTEEGLKIESSVEMVNLNIDLLFEDGTVKNTQAYCEVIPKENGFKIYLVSLTEPDFPFPEIPYFATEQNCVYCFKLVSPETLKEKLVYNSSLL